MEYENVVKKGLWHKAVDLGNKEMVVVHNPQLIVHYQVWCNFTYKCCGYALHKNFETIKTILYILFLKGYKAM